MNQPDEIEEFLRLHPTEPLKKPKAPPPKLEVVSSTEPPLEALRANAAKAQERLFHEEQVAAYSWRKNFKRYGRAMPPSQAEVRKQHLEDGFNAAMERIRHNQMMERFYRRELDPFHLGLYGPTSDDE